jgi:tripartite-type tricarboxylate transporter receptor subunit TctC
VENRGGQAGNFGAAAAFAAEPDGYTLMASQPAPLTVNALLYRKLNYNPVAFLPIAIMTTVPNTLTVRSDFPAKTAQEFIAYARANPGKLNYGTPAVGTVNQLMIERLKQATGIEITHIPYKGSPEATLALLKNDIQLFPIGLSVGIGHLREGKLTALAVAAPQRLDMLPDVPTMSEAGFPGYDTSNWWGMAAPAGTAADILDTVQQAVVAALQTAAVEARYREMGMLAPKLSRQQFAASLAAEAQLWSQTIARGNIRVE